jgi:hypothetical protein
MAVAQLWIGRLTWPNRPAATNPRHFPCSDDPTAFAFPGAALVWLFIF